MVQTTLTTSNIGLEVFRIEVEVSISGGLPATIIVGLPDKSVQESRERIRTAITQSGFEYPLGKVVINLAPADVVKVGTRFDVAIAIGILTSSGVVQPSETIQQALFIGELALDGSLRATKGVLNSCLWAKKYGIPKVFIPEVNKLEAAFVEGIEIIAVSNLAQIVAYLNGKIELQPVQGLTWNDFQTEEEHEPKNDFAYVKGQSVAKRALEIAAAGGHNICMIGQPGSGKTMLARALPTILPPLSMEEAIEITQIYSVAGLLDIDQLLCKRPIRSPHHSASHVAMVGGGAQLKPGEIALAHRGVLFLDEFPEFNRTTLEALRQPLEEGYIDISRAAGKVRYPASCILVAAANPTPGGYATNDTDAMYQSVSAGAVQKYQAKFSGPIMDRIDLYVSVNRPEKEQLMSDSLAEPSSQIRARVIKAKEIQTHRFKQTKVRTNAEMSAQDIQTYCQLDSQTQAFLDKAYDTYKLTGRGYHRILKVARTIADLRGGDRIEVTDVAESLQFRKNPLFEHSHS